MWSRWSWVRVPSATLPRKVAPSAHDFRRRFSEERMPRRRAEPASAATVSRQVTQSRSGNEPRYAARHGPVAQRIERRTSNPCAEVRLLPGPSPFEVRLSFAEPSRLQTASCFDPSRCGRRRQSQHRRRYWQNLGSNPCPGLRRPRRPRLISRSGRCGRSVGRPTRSPARLGPCDRVGPAGRPTVF